MLSSFADFFKNPSDIVFGVSAIVGTTLFVLRMLLSLFGGLDDVEDGDFDEVDTAHHHEHEQSTFKILSLHSISGFFMMFGLVGLGCSAQLGFSTLESVLSGVCAGTVLTFLSAALFKSARYFKSPGQVFAIEKTIGLIGTVYQEIPAKGQGKIHVIVNGITREMLAMARDNKTIESFAVIKIVRVIDHDLVEVIRQ